MYHYSDKEKYPSSTLCCEITTEKKNTIVTVLVTNLIDLSAGFEVIALITAAEQLKRLVHVVPRILDL